MSAPLSGVLTALATPFTADDEVDYARLRALVDRSVGAGVDGVVVCGSTGEVGALSVAERRRAVETVVEHTAGRVAVIAQTGATSTAEAIRASRHAQQAGADVIMPVTPYYEPITLAETTDYISAVADAVELPVMLYNIPAATGVNLDPDTVGALAREVGNIRYIKDSSADMVQANQLIHHHREHIGMFMGWDTLIFSALMEGAAGAVAGAANVVPAALVAVHRAVTTGDYVSAKAEWDRVYPLIDALISAPFVPAIKAALAVLDHPIGDPRAPTAPLAGEELARIEDLTARLRLTTERVDGRIGN